MIKSILAASVILVSSTSLVQAGSSPEEVCETYHSFAETIMLKRQEGVAMPRMMEAMKGNSIGRDIVQDAYNHPRYNTEGVKAQVIQEFANDTYAECYMSVSQ